MDWSRASDSVQIIANLAVIASVLFLAMQAKLAIQMLRDSAERNHMAKYQSINQILAENVQLAELWGRGSANGIDSLNSAERIQFINFYSYFLRIWLELHSQNRKGIIYPELWKTNATMLRDTAQMRGAKEVWELRRHAYPAEFQQFYDDLVARSDEAQQLYGKTRTTDRRQ